MRDLLSEVVSKFCHDISSTLTAFGFGVESMDKNEITDDLRLAVDKGNITVTFFRSFFIDPSFESLTNLIKILIKKVNIDIRDDLKLCDHKFLIGALYVCFQSTSKKIYINHNKVSMLDGVINKNSVICECLLQHFPLIDIKEREILIIY